MINTFTDLLRRIGESIEALQWELLAIGIAIYFLKFLYPLIVKRGGEIRLKEDLPFIGYTIILVGIIVSYTTVHDAIIDFPNEVLNAANIPNKLAYEKNIDSNIAELESLKEQSISDDSGLFSGVAALLSPAESSLAAVEVVVTELNLILLNSTKLIINTVESIIGFVSTIVIYFAPICILLIGFRYISVSIFMAIALIPWVLFVSLLGAFDPAAGSGLTLLISIIAVKIVGLLSLTFGFHIAKIIYKGVRMVSDDITKGFANTKALNAATSPSSTNKNPQRSNTANNAASLDKNERKSIIMQGHKGNAPLSRQNIRRLNSSNPENKRIISRS